MNKKGKLLTCDRCGEEIFLEHIGVGDTDGGYTRWDKYEDAPHGCGRVDSLDVCPKCNEEYKLLLEKFWNKRKE